MKVFGSSVGETIGRLIMAFEDSEQIKRRKMDWDVFHLHAKEEVLDLLINAGFSGDTKLISRTRGKLIFHCVIAKKKVHNKHCRY